MPQTRNIYRKVLLCLCVMSFAVFFLFMLFIVIVHVTTKREPPFWSRCGINLHQIAFAMHNYHDIYHAFPPPYIADESGTPIHSWRILILPYAGLEYVELFKEYNFAEPWNGPHNSKLHEKMPPLYRCSSIPVDSNCTSFMMIVGPNTLCNTEKKGTMSDLVFVETNNTITNWLEPADFPINNFHFGMSQERVPSSTLQRLGNHFNVTAMGTKIRVTGAALRDGRILRISEDTSPISLTTMSTIGGGENVVITEPWGKSAGIQRICGKCE